MVSVWKTQRRCTFSLVKFPQAGISKLRSSLLTRATEWEQGQNAEHFISSIYPQWIGDLESRIGARPKSAPFTMELLPSMIGACEPAPDGICSVYLVSFDASLTPAQERILVSDLDILRQLLHKSENYIGMSKGWIIPPLQQFRDRGASKTLVLIMGWSDIESEEWYEKNATISAGAESNKMLSLHDRLFQPLLEAAKPG